jgi:hypothetical protein
MWIRYTWYLVSMLSGLSLGGCGSLLPQSKQTSDLPWSSYENGQAAFSSIVPEKTTLADLRAMGINPKDTPNVTLLNHADTTRKLVTYPTMDVKRLPASVQACIASPYHCYAYEIEQKHIERKREGSFWPDFFNFKRHVQISGWQFDALLVIQDELVVYKLWSGKANIRQQEEEHNPLGPLQGMGGSVIP